MSEAKDNKDHSTDGLNLQESARPSVLHWFGFNPARLWPLACVPAAVAVVSVMFALCYNAIYENNPEAFRFQNRHNRVEAASSSFLGQVNSSEQVETVNGDQKGHDDLRLRDFLYYSYFVLITGSPDDISPNCTLVRLISVTESMAGIMLLVLLVAILTARLPGKTLGKAIFRKG